MAKKRRSKSRSRRKPTSYQPKATAQKPQARPNATEPERAREPGTTRPKPVYTGQRASRLSAMDIDNDQVMYSYVKKDLTRIGILTLIMFGSLIVLKIAGVS